MDKTSSEKFSTVNKKRLIGLLIQGRDSTKKLQNLLLRQLKDDGSVSVEDLLMKIRGSFSDSLSELGSCDSGELCQLLVSANAGSDSSGPGKGGKKPAPAEKDRRGCYKRRKTADSRIRITETMEDGHAWRKYGQKEILKAKFPRCYFRCTYKSAQGCKALKQVQKLEDGSNKFHITYFGYHTCQNVHKTTHRFSDSGSLNSFILNFEDSKTHLHQPPSTPSTITNTHIAPSVKQEDASKAQSDDLSPSDNVSSASYGQSSLKEMISYLEPSHASVMGFDYEDSCASTSPHSFLDIDIFKNGSRFDHSDLRLDDEFLFSQY